MLTKDMGIGSPINSSAVLPLKDDSPENNNEDDRIRNSVNFLI